MNVVTFGEIMLRLKSPGQERLFQSPRLEATFGGSEANVAVALARMGMPASFATVLPDNQIGRECMRELRFHGVDVSLIKSKPGRIGIYFFENGANQRASNVIYDRAGSAIAEMEPGDIDWVKAFSGASWFHISGITPAVSRKAADASIAAAKAAREAGLTVLIRPQFPGEALELRRQGQGGDVRNRRLRRRSHRKRRGLPEIPRHRGAKKAPWRGGSIRRDTRPCAPGPWRISRRRVMRQ